GRHRLLHELADHGPQPVLHDDDAQPRPGSAARGRHRQGEERPAIHDFIMRLAGVDADCARHINSSVAGMMFSELVSGTADRANVETYLREFFSWLDNVRASA